MATTKHRINISLSDEMTAVLNKLARRDQVPTATKTVQMLQLALEIEEDDCLNTLARERDTKHTRFVKHEQVWA